MVWHIQTLKIYLEEQLLRKYYMIKAFNKKTFKLTITRRITQANH